MGSCPNKEHMQAKACQDSAQCWEPCGDIGKHVPFCGLRNFIMQQKLEVEPAFKTELAKAYEEYAKHISNP